MVNNIAVDKNGELVDSFELKNPDKIYFTEFVKEQFWKINDIIKMP
ncbi:MAG TPA: hypothetical protein VMW20_00335 [Candidatus Nanoarchaeia archaeon]|nr:hypothetical protein [Candidatus Nanoarchaeia archaeon]